MILIYLGCTAIAAFALALVLGLTGAAPAAVAHAAFAIGALPLIFAAMSHFVPVLTRSGGAEPGVHRLPLVLQAAGVVAVAVVPSSTSQTMAAAVAPSCRHHRRLSGSGSTSRTPATAPR